MQNLKLNIATKQNMKVTVEGNHNLKNKIKKFRKHFTFSFKSRICRRFDFFSFLQKG